MRISPRSIFCGLLAAGFSLSAANAAQAAGHFYVPFTLSLNTTGQDQGIWLADTDHLGNPPYQLTNQPLDGGPNGSSSNIAILNDWTLNATTHQATNVQPQLVVYGVSGHLHKANLKTIGPVTQFSSGSYAQLCSLTALDERPYAAAKAYVQAVVEPTGSVNTCASGIGTQTWLIPANADNTVAPIIEPANWTVLSAFTDPTDESFVRWVVWTGNEVDAYKANFTAHTTLLVGPPTGPAPTLIGRMDGTAYLLSGSDNSVTHTDNLYRVTMSGSGLVASYSYPDGSPCSVGVTTTGVITSSIADTLTGMLAFTEPSATGYAVYSVSFAGSAPSQIYADNSSSECGTIGGDAVSAGYVGLNEVDLSTSFQHVIAINEAGPVSQAPVTLASGAQVIAFLRYTVDGHFWIDIADESTSPIQRSELVADGDGTVVQDYLNSRLGDDIWGGYDPSGRNPGVERDVIYLFSPGSGGSCASGALTAIDPAAFTSTSISGLPTDACTALAYGWQPASVGYVIEPAGASPVEIDPVGGKMYTLLGPDSTGIFINLALLSGYPFY